MSSIKSFTSISLITLFILFTGSALLQNCQTVPPEIYDNPLDTLATPIDGDDPIETPALVFFPADVTVGLGLGATVQVFALEVDDLSGAHIIVEYDENKLNLLSVAEGDIFSGSLETIFIFEDDPITGILDIYASYLGSDTVAVNGTGSIADMVFTTLSAGQTTLTYSTECTFVDPNNIPITILGYGEGVINAE